MSVCERERERERKRSGCMIERVYEGEGVSE